MSNTVIRPKDRAEWLEYRKDGIGSSDNPRPQSVGNSLPAMETQKRAGRPQRRNLCDESRALSRRCRIAVLG